LQPEPPSRLDYLNYAKASADWFWNHYDEQIRKWKEGFDPDNVFGYRPPGGLLETAVIYAYLYEQENRSDWAQRTKRILLSYGDFRSMFPQWARENRPDYDAETPMLPDFFTVMRFIRAYEVLKKHQLCSPEEKARIESEIAHSLRYLLRAAEWGTMNRTVLRAETLAWAVRVMPTHPDALKWEMQRKALGDDNWGNWEIEDASVYHAVWLYSLCGYAFAMNRLDELFLEPEIYYYSHYFLNLMCPAGMIPDFGDANWMANWGRYLVFFETAAARYHNSQLKWAAAVIAGNFIDFNTPDNVSLGYLLLDCYLWSSDEVIPEAPSSLSREVMEDVQGKKIVFRNGWEEDSTYLLLNYRDEGDGGSYFRDYLRDTIPVEEEKMTHGHADENSIVLLMSGGSVLLHDGGYRDFMPSGPFGAYRQDYFHNRICVRPEKIFMGQNKGEYRYSIRDGIPGQKVLEFLHNAGSYRKVRTQKIDFLNLPEFDYSRSRLIDDKWGYEWDRIIIYVKDEEMFVIFDIIKSLREEYFTISNLWHTRKILDRGPHWYDTVYDQIQDQSLPINRQLLIHFPQAHFRLEGVEEEKRHYQEELAIYQATAQHFELGETVGFITVLSSHSSALPPEKIVERIHLLPIENPKDGMGIEIRLPGKRLILGAKKNLRQDIARDWRRPRYTFEAGKILFGDFLTNGDFLFAEIGEKAVDYTAVNLTRMDYQGQKVFEVEDSLFGLNFDASPYVGGKGKVRYWRDRITLTRPDLPTEKNQFTGGEKK
jgi:hypothetical protein